MKIRFLRSQKYLVDANENTIVKHEVGDVEEYPEDFCDFCIKHGAAERVEDKEDKKAVKEKVKKIKDEEEAAAIEKEKHGKKAVNIIKRVERLLKEESSNKARKEKLAQWAEDKYKVKLNKNFGLQTMINNLVKEVL